MSLARFLSENDLPEEPPLPRAQGGIIGTLPLMTTAEKNQRQLTGALNHLADAINQLAQAIVATYRPPTTDTQAEGGSPGPAKGLTTQIRPTPEHRNRTGPGPHRWFGPVTAEGGEQ